MHKAVRTRLAQISLSAALIFSIIMALTFAGTAFAAAPPYGAIIDDVWVYEGLDAIASYSFSPVPKYREDSVAGPEFVLAAGTKFEYYYANDVEIRKLLNWDNPGLMSLEGSPVFENYGDGSYTFNEPGYYAILFANEGVLPVEVAGSTASPTAPPSGGIKVTLDGKLLAFDVPPQIVNGRTLVPLRVIFEALGASVDWNSNTRTVTAVRDNTTVILKINSNILSKNGVPVSLDVPAQLIGGRTMVPARAIAEAFGDKVEWIGSAQTVKITTGASANTPATGGNTSYADAYAGILTYYCDFSLSKNRDRAIDSLIHNLTQNFEINGDKKRYELESSAFEAFDASKLGYAFYDINNDGITELLIITDESYDYSDFIYAIYTLRNGSPYLVGAYWSRNRCGLGKNGTVYCQGSNGASDSFIAAYRLDSESGELQMIKQISMSEVPENPIKDAGLVFKPLS